VGHPRSLLSNRVLMPPQPGRSCLPRPPTPLVFRCICYATKNQQYGPFEFKILLGEQVEVDPVRRHRRPSWQSQIQAARVSCHQPPRPCDCVHSRSGQCREISYVQCRAALFCLSANRTVTSRNVTRRLYLVQPRASRSVTFPFNLLTCGPQLFQMDAEPIRHKIQCVFSGECRSCRPSS
jgi:hypothetical protein